MKLLLRVVLILCITAFAASLVAHFYKMAVMNGVFVVLLALAYLREE